jgi:hypothetical protein
MTTTDTTYIFRKCITLKNGRRICLPGKQAFRIPVRDTKAE